MGDGDGLAGVASAEEAVAVGGDAGESWVGFGSGVERGEWGSSTDRAMRSPFVVVVDEAVELALE